MGAWPTGLVNALGVSVINTSERRHAGRRQIYVNVVVFLALFFLFDGPHATVRRLLRVELVPV